VIEHRIGTSRRSDMVHVVSKAVARPTLKYFPLSGPATKLIPLLERSAAFIPRLSQVVHKPVMGRTWRGEIVTPIDGPTSDGAILYLHGGAFLMCGMATHRRIVERLAERTGMTVLSVDYRQLPVGRLHDSVSDCEDAFHWLVRTGHPASKIVIAGDSAGGHLAFATALRLRDDGTGTPAAIVGMSPWLDFDHMAKVRHHNARRDAYIPARRLRKVARMVVGEHPELHHSPVNADLQGLPPSLIICAEAEVLRCDAELMAERLAAAGVPATLQIWEGQVHAFPVLTDLTPESREALEEVVGFVHQAVAAAGNTGRRGRRAGRLTGLSSAGVA
jgi:acetyl esterase/lipase